MICTIEIRLNYSHHICNIIMRAGVCGKHNKTANGWNATEWNFPANENVSSLTNPSKTIDHFFDLFSMFLAMNFHFFLLFLFYTFYHKFLIQSDNYVIGWNGTYRYSIWMCFIVSRISKAVKSTWMIEEKTKFYQWEFFYWDSCVGVHSSIMSPWLVWNMCIKELDI